jgi:hypothetical protein
MMHQIDIKGIIFLSENYLNAGAKGSLTSGITYKSWETIATRKGCPGMRIVLLALALQLFANQATSQVGAVTKAIRGAETASEAANAGRATKAGTKLIAADGAAYTINGSEQIISNATKALIAARTAQVINKCKSYDTSKTKDSMCQKRSEEFQRCIASEMEYTSLVNTAISRCTKLYN